MKNGLGTRPAKVRGPTKRVTPDSPPNLTRTLIVDATPCVRGARNGVSVLRGSCLAQVGLIPLNSGTTPSCNYRDLFLDLSEPGLHTCDLPTNF